MFSSSVNGSRGILELYAFLIIDLIASLSDVNFASALIRLDLNPNLVLNLPLAAPLSSKSNGLLKSSSTDSKNCLGFFVAILITVSNRSPIAPGGRKLLPALMLPKTVPTPSPWFPKAPPTNSVATSASGGKSFSVSNLINSFGFCLSKESKLRT